MLSAPYNCGIWFDCKTSWMANSKKEEDQRQRLYSYSSLLPFNGQKNCPDEGSEAIQKSLL